MRSYGAVPPVLSTAQPPKVSGVTGLGTGGGAGVQSKGLPSDGQGFGYVDIMTGSNPSVGGNVALTFPAVPPTLAFAGDEAFGLLSIAGQGTVNIVLTWTPQLPPKRRLRIAYEWANSQ